jgi:hypothetical protein
MDLKKPYPLDCVLKFIRNFKKNVVSKCGVEWGLDSVMWDGYSDNVYVDRNLAAYYNSEANIDTIESIFIGLKMFHPIRDKRLVDEEEVRSVNLDELYDDLFINPLEAFHSARTWDELLRANIKFLNGKLYKTPYHMGPLDPETTEEKGMVGKLVKLHQNPYKMFTTNGQPPKKEIDVVIERGPNIGKYYSTRQKSHVGGIVQKRIVDLILNIIKKRKDIVYQIYDFKTADVIGNHPEEALPLTDEYVADEPGTAQVWETYSKSHKFTKTNPFTIGDYGVNMNKYIRQNCCGFEIIINEYNTPYSIEDVLLDSENI